MSNAENANNQNEARENFERWYVKPLQILERIPNGDGAFVALATSCFLYERYVVAEKSQHIVYSIRLNT